MTYTETKARELVVEAGRKLLAQGLVERTWGNISARVSDTHFVITPSGMAYDTLQPEDLVLVDGRDGSHQGEKRPSSEKSIHADVYRLRPSAGFVIHTHQDMASVYGVVGRELETDHPLLGTVPCAAYGLPSTGKLRRAVAESVAACPGSRAVLMRHHGALCVGDDMAEAFAVAEALEAASAAAVSACLGAAAVPPYVPDLGESVRRGDSFLLTVKGERRICLLEDQTLRGAAALHAAVYRSCDATVIAQARDEETVAASMAGKTLRPLLDDLAQIAGGDIRCVGARERGVLLGLRGRNAVLVRGAGALCTGISQGDVAAVEALVRKGCLARRYAAARGNCRPLSRGDAWLQRLIYVTQYEGRRQ